MPKTVSSTEAQNRFAMIMEWANDHKDGVVIEVRGQPRVAVISYGEYAELLWLRKQEAKRQALAALKMLRAEIQPLLPPMTSAEAYAEAGISPNIIQELLESDAKLAGQANVASHP